MIISPYLAACGGCISHCSRGPTPARSRSATSRLARAAGAFPSPLSLFPCPFSLVSSLSLPWRPRDLPSTQQMEVDVEDRLSGVAVGVEDSRIAALLAAGVPGDLRRRAHHFSDERVVAWSEIVEALDVSSRDDEDV